MCDFAHCLLEIYSLVGIISKFLTRYGQKSHMQLCSARAKIRTWSEVALTQLPLTFFCSLFQTMYKSIRSDNLSSVLWTKKCGMLFKRQLLSNPWRKTTTGVSGKLITFDCHCTTAWARWSVSRPTGGGWCYATDYSLQVKTLEIPHFATF